jgi:hypothetical protein
MCCVMPVSRWKRAVTVRGERKVGDPGGAGEIALRHLSVRLRPTWTRPGPPRIPGASMKRRLATLSIVSALMTLAAQPAFAGVMNLGN